MTASWVLKFEGSWKAQKSKYRENKFFLEIKSFVPSTLKAILWRNIINFLAEGAFKILHQSVGRNIGY